MTTRTLLVALAALTLPCLANARSPAPPERVIVELRSDDLPDRNQPLSSRRLRALRERGDALVSRLPAAERETARRMDYVPYVTIEADARTLDALRRDRDVVRVLPDALHRPTLDDSVPLIGGDIVQAHGWDGGGTAIAILDTGVDPDHPMLAGRVTHQMCAVDFQNCQAAWAAGNAGAACTGIQANVPNCDHGTHVAGIAAGNGSGLVGVAPQADIFAYQVFHRSDSNVDCDGSPPCLLSWTSSQMAALDNVVAMVANGWPVASVNMSLGNDTENVLACNGHALAGHVTLLAALGVPVVISSGNEGHDTGVGSPGCIGQAVTVGSTNKSDMVAGSSNSGPELDLLAPGVGITSATAPGGGTGSKSGTSMAAPHVAGAFAVLREHSPQASFNTKFDTLVNTGVPITDPKSGLTRPRVDLIAALQSLGAWIEPCVLEGGDWDGDDVCGDDDNCPQDANPSQLDDDFDGLGNACDNCVGTWNPDQADLNLDGEGDACDPDIDGDTCLNGDDDDPYDPWARSGTYYCLDTKESGDSYVWAGGNLFEDHLKHCEDPDDDNDGLLDEDDPCPHTADSEDCTEITLCDEPEVPELELPFDICLFGGCDEILLRGEHYINPVPLEFIEVGRDVIVIQPAARDLDATLELLLDAPRGERLYLVANTGERREVVLMGYDPAAISLSNRGGEQIVLQATAGGIDLAITTR